MDELQAAVANVKLDYLKEDIEKRRLIALEYKKQLRKLPISFPKVHIGSYETYNMFVIFCKSRDELIKYLKQNNIEAKIHYPLPVHKMSVVCDNPDDVELSSMTNTLWQASNMITLPIQNINDKSEVSLVTKTIKQFYNKELVK